MRGDAWFAGAMAAVAVLAGAVLGAALSGPQGIALGGAAGLGVGAVLWRVLTARGSRRDRIRQAPFPDDWRRILEERYDHYHRLPSEPRRRFEEHVALFLAETRITGVEVEATLERRLLVAASAATLTAGWEGDHWEEVAEVLLYKKDFGRDYSFDEDDLSGQAHPWGTIILSVPTLEESFDDPDDGFHVGLHEFAHLLDVEQTHFDGVPRGLDGARAREWLDVVDKEMDRLRRGKSILDPYAQESPAEFLAVAVETFFEQPLDLRQRHREVYAILSDYFRQDPATWDEARGLD
ncbi:MAG TPA: M90 family metallopeptidase [Vicinamibacteria bacterium]|nr:M90 family metallopeptidase [Vicinamibacteria bacterium]